MKKILVPVDFSDQSISAFRMALDIAGQSKGTVCLLHVVSFPTLHESALMPVAGYKQPLEIELKEAARNKLKNLVNDFRTSDVPVSASATIGRIQGELLNHITENGIDLVVMGTKGSSGLREWMIGSNTEKMVRTSPVPVMAVKRYQPTHTIQDIVFPNTLDREDQEDLIMKVKVLQNFFRAALRIIWVNTPAIARPEEEIRKKLKEFAERHMITNYTINVFNYTDEESGIVEFTRQIGADLIAMSTHGLTGLTHLIAGSIAEDVVNHVQYPVWTYRTRSVPFQNPNNQ